MTSSAALAEHLRVAIGDFVRRTRHVDTLGSSVAAVLGHLAREGELSITALAAKTGVKHQSMARTVQNLQRLHLAQVSSDAADRRRVIVTITQTGLDRLLQEQKRRSAWLAQAIEAHLSLDERTDLDRLVALLERLSRPQ